MSYSPSYSPVLDTADQRRNLFSNNEQGGTLSENSIEDNNPVTNPFYYAQDRESWYAEVAAKVIEESRTQKAEEHKLKQKRKKSLSFKNKSFIIRKESERAHHSIKIIIHNLDGPHVDDDDFDNANVNVQYLVTSDYDDIMSETEHLVDKIVKKVSKSDTL